LEENILNLRGIGTWGGYRPFESKGKGKKIRSSKKYARGDTKEFEGESSKAVHRKGFH